MLIRDKVGKQLMAAVEEVKDSQVEVIRLSTNEEFFQAIMNKIKSELEMLEQTRSIDNLAELMELIEWIQVALGSTDLKNVMDHRTDKLGLYWEKFYIKEKE